MKIKIKIPVGIVISGAIALASHTFGQNSVPFSDSFEQYPANSSIIGSNNWIGATNTYATVTNMTYSFSATQHPLRNATHSKVVQLNTENGAITNLVTSTSETQVWIDSMVQFQLWSDDAPPSITNDTGIRAAFYINNQSNLVIYHTDLDPGLWSGSNVFTVIPYTTIASGQWVRLTVNMDYSDDFEGVSFFRVQLDGGEAITNALAFDAPNSFGSFGGSNFVSANLFPSGTHPLNLSSVGFSGTGYIDDFVVTNGQVQFSIVWTITTTNYPASGGGVMDPVAGVITLGDNESATITNLPATYWSNAYLVVDGVTNAPAATYAFNNVTSNHTYTVYFVPDMAASNTPHWWLDSFGLPLTDNSATNDPDTDGFPSWMEYIASTDPTDSNSFFRITGSYRLNGTNYFTWTSKGIDPNLPPFGIRRVTNLVTDTWTNLVGTQARSTNNVWAETGVVPTNVPVFYRVVATNSP